METHPELGERILAPIELLQDVCPIVRDCHERYDGESAQAFLDRLRFPDGARHLAHRLENPRNAHRGELGPAGAE
mgnify:CR=1 FL=1